VCRHPRAARRGELPRLLRATDFSGTSSSLVIPAESGTCQPKRLGRRLQDRSALQLGAVRAVPNGLSNDIARFCVAYVGPVRDHGPPSDLSVVAVLNQFGIACFIVPGRDRMSHGRRVHLFAPRSDHHGNKDTPTAGETDGLVRRRCSPTWAEPSNNANRHIGMKLALWLILLPAIVTGCLGGGSGHAASSGGSPPADLVFLPATSLSISYPVSQIVHLRSDLSPCPVGATCRDVRLPVSCERVAGTCPMRPWVRVAVRRLTCSPSGGDYQDTATVCTALDDLEHRRQAARGFCSCPAMLDGYPMARANGRYNGRRLRLPLDSCSLCALGSHAAHDAAVLMPQ
jgi:hypothetical protein